MTETIHVVAGALVDGDGKVLLARRPDGAHQGGLWEFPGGKREHGESRAGALARELAEEIGIAVQRARPLIAVSHTYPDRDVLLDVWRVDAWRGEPHGREGQPVEWLSPDRFAEREFPPADLPVLAALRLPSRYLITPEPARADLDGFLARLGARVRATGASLVQLRVKRLEPEPLLALAGRAAAACEALGARLLLNGDPTLANESGAHGVHLTSERLMGLEHRPLAAGRLVGASCHDAAQLCHAHRIGADFAVLGPVCATASHPGAQPLGWNRFADLAATASLPVYALGGVGPEDEDRAWAAGGQGIAAIRSLWGTAG